VKIRGKHFLNCTKNTELTQRPFARTFLIRPQQEKIRPRRNAPNPRSAVNTSSTTDLGSAVNTRNTVEEQRFSAA